jgi:hypothetical protein
MPSEIKGHKVDEAKWKRAQAQAKKEGKGGNYAYIMSIYKAMAHLDKAVELFSPTQLLKAKEVKKSSGPSLVVLLKAKYLSREKVGGKWKYTYHRPTAGERSNPSKQSHEEWLAENHRMHDERREKEKSSAQQELHSQGAGSKKVKLSSEGRKTWAPDWGDFHENLEEAVSQMSDGARRNLASAIKKGAQLDYPDSVEEEASIDVDDIESLSEYLSNWAKNNA